MIRKLTLVFLCLLFCFCYAITKKGYVKYCDVIYNLDSYKFNPTTQTHYIDVYMNIEGGGHAEIIYMPKSDVPIYLLVFSTQYNKNNGLKISYKGYVSGDWEERTKGYYERHPFVVFDSNKKNIPDFDEWQKQLQIDMSGQDKEINYMYYKKMITDIYNSAKANKASTLGFKQNALGEIRTAQGDFISFTD